MKILLFNCILTILLSCSNVYGQPKGVNYDGALNSKAGDNALKTDILLYQNDSTFFYAYKMNPIGIKHAITKLFELLKANELEYDWPDYEDVYLASYVDNIFDYESLDTSIKVGKSEVIQAWYVDDWFIGIVLNESLYMISICKRAKETE